MPRPLRVRAALLVRVKVDLMMRSSLRAVLIGAALLVSGGALAATCQSNANGNWNATATWTGCTGGNGTPTNTPGSNDDVQIRNGNTVTIPAGLSAAARSVTFTASNGAASLTHAASTSTLTVGVGGVTMNPSGNNNPKNWNINAGSATVNGPVTLNGTSTNNRPVQIFITTGTLDINGNLSMNAGNAVRAVIDMSGGAGNLFISGSFTFASSDGTLAPGTTSTVTFDSATTPVTVQTGSSVSYNNLVIAKGAGNVANAATTGNLTVGGALTVTSGTFNIPGITSSVTGATSVTGTLGITSATGTKTFTGAVTVNGGATWSNSGNASVVMGAGLSNSGTFTAGNGTYTLTGDLTNSNTFNAGTGTFSLTGNFTDNGTFSASTGTFNFNGGVAQTLTGTASGTTTFANLTVNNANGLTLTGTHNATVSTLLTLTSGILSTGSNVLTISNGSNITGAGATQFVNGNLSKTVGTGGCTTCNFEIGSIAGGNRYVPVTNVTFTGITTSGTVTAATTASDHPNVATSGLDNTLDVNRYWTLVNTGVVFTSYGATFNWVAADLDSGADTTVFEMQRYSPPAPAAGTWNSTTTAARTTTSIQISGVTGFGDFAAGQTLAAAAGIGRFNAYDTGTAAGSVTGFITTKLAGTAFSVAVVALANNRASINTGYAGTVQMTLLDASDNSGTLDSTTNCNTSWATIQTLPNLVFNGSENGRKDATITENNAWRQVRIRMVDGGFVGCSTDAFAIRPSNFTVSITDANWSTAGSGRVLNNTSATGGIVHKAGQPFTITVTPGSSSNYDGNPTVATVGGLSCTLPVSCTNGTLSLGTFTGSGNRISSTATYTEAGAFNLTLEDRLFAVVDAADGTPSDCSATGRFICQTSAPQAVGRFVPDHFTFTSPNTPILLTFNNSACGSRSFTYIGQPFWYATGSRPSATVNAVEAGGAPTINYSMSAGLLGESYADAGAPAAAPLNSASIGTPTLSGSGTGTYIASLGGTLSYSRSATTPVGPFTASIALTVSASDSSESAVTGNGTITTPSPLVFNGGGSGVAFDSGAQLRFGRLRAGNGNGSQLVPLLVALETQYYSGAPANTFLTNTSDSCTAIAANNIELASYTANLSACNTSLTVSAFSSGRATVLMSAPGSGRNGSVQLTPRLESSVTGATTCIGGVSTSVIGADKAYLQGNWTATTYTQNPTGLETFGAYRGSAEIIDFRENY